MTDNDAEKNHCSEKSGRYFPVVDRNRCEGKEDCVRVCPYNVFKVDVLKPAARKGLSLRGKIKGFAHGWKQAVVMDPEACHACGLCIAACPEKALTLRILDDTN